MRNYTKENMLTLDWIKSLGPERSIPPDVQVLKAIKDVTQYDISYIFDINPKDTLQGECREGFSFFRTVEELNIVMDYSYLLQAPIQFAPFGVSYNLSKKKKRKKSVDWSIDTYGICFDGQYKDVDTVYIWDGDRDYVHSWPSYSEFIEWLRPNLVSS
jgi:hypothetical protein